MFHYWRICCITDPPATHMLGATCEPMKSMTLRCLPLTPLWVFLGTRNVDVTDPAKRHLVLKRSVAQHGVFKPFRNHFTLFSRVKVAHKNFEAVVNSTRCASFDPFWHGPTIICRQFKSTAPRKFAPVVWTVVTFCFNRCLMQCAWMVTSLLGWAPCLPWDYTCLHFTIFPYNPRTKIACRLSSMAVLELLGYSSDSFSLLPLGNSVRYRRYITFSLLDGY